MTLLALAAASAAPPAPPPPPASPPSAAAGLPASGAPGSEGRLPVGGPASRPAFASEKT